jgi:hypothetical protein
MCVRHRIGEDFMYEVTKRLVLCLRASRCVSFTTKQKYDLFAIAPQGSSFLYEAVEGGYKLVTLPRIVTPYRDGVDGTRARVTYQKLVTR